MERILLFIKHHLSALWRIIDRFNGLLFNFIFSARLNKVLPGVFSDVPQDGFTYRRLNSADLNTLYDLISSQPSSDLKFFNPHGFDHKSLAAHLKKPSFLMMGAFKEGKMVGYFFLRFFVNRRCFVGRLIDRQFRGMNIGTKMNFIMYETAWRMKFRCLSTISKHNMAVMKAHARNRQMRILRDLPNDYLLVEFVK